jgi:predicted TIM-barrel fold metal-dependent hydrolase
VLFGSEYPLQHPSVELAKFQALGVPPDQWRQIAWDNAHRLLSPPAHRKRIEPAIPGGEMR